MTEAKEHVAIRAARPSPPPPHPDQIPPSTELTPFPLWQWLRGRWRPSDHSVLLPPLPPPMPEVQRVLPMIDDALSALRRARGAWRAKQVLDAIVSARRFLDEAEQAVTHEVRKDALAAIEPSQVVHDFEKFLENRGHH